MEKDSQKKQSQLKSFMVALEGLKVLFSNERNFRIHLAASFIVLAACFCFKVTATEWIVVLLLISIVLCTEALNTGIEYLCDYVAPEFQPMIKKTKDVAAGAVLLTAIIAIIVGCIIFIPYIKSLI